VHDATRLMGELGVTCAIETAPGHVLSRLLASAVPTVVALSLEDDGLSAAASRADSTLLGHGRRELTGVAPPLPTAVTDEAQVGA
jgi:hypothetical protein